MLALDLWGVAEICFDLVQYGVYIHYCPTVLKWLLYLIWPTLYTSCPLLFFYAHTFYYKNIH